MSKQYKVHTTTHNIMMTIILVAVIRLFYSIPTPGVDLGYFKEMADTNRLMGFIDVLSGGGFSGLSVMALNITPYITASIIVQLISHASTRLHDMRRGMKDEQDRVEKGTLILGVVLAFVQGIAISAGYGSTGVLIHNTRYWMLLVSGIWAFGTALASFTGKWIQDHYQFNGVSAILLLNIVSSYPGGAHEIYSTFIQGRTMGRQILILLVIVLFVFALFLLTFELQEAEKTIQIHYSGKSNSAQTKTVGNFPIRLCPGGVVPMIFASTVMSLPPMIAGMFTERESLWMKILSSSYWFRPEEMLPTLGVILYVGLIYLFSYFYAYTQVNPHEIAEHMMESGGTVAGIRPGRSTELYITRQMKSCVLLGATALTGIALVPIVLSGVFGLSKIAFLGTSIIITVGVILEFKKNITAANLAARYKETRNSEGGLF